MKITLKGRELLALNNAIKAMDGRLKVVRDGDGKYVGILFEPYSLDGRTIYALARTAEQVRPLMAALEKSQSELEKKAKADGSALNDELFDLFDQEIEIEVQRVPIAGLKVETNQVPASVLSALLPMVDGSL